MNANEVAHCWASVVARHKPDDLRGPEGLEQMLALNADATRAWYGLTDVASAIDPAAENTLIMDAMPFYTMGMLLSAAAHDPRISRYVPSFSHEVLLLSNPVLREWNDHRGHYVALTVSSPQRYRVYGPANANLRIDVSTHNELCRQKEVLGYGDASQALDVLAYAIGLVDDLIGQTDPPTKPHPVHAAILSGDVDAVTSMVESGAYVDARDAGGFTGLMHAVRNLDVDMVTCLLDHDADPDLVHRGFSAKMLASWMSHDYPPIFAAFQNR